MFLSFSFFCGKEGFVRRDKRNIRDRMREDFPSSEVLSRSYFYLEEMDRHKGTNLLDVFVVIYLIEERMTLEELSARLHYSLTAVKKALMEVCATVRSMAASSRKVADLESNSTSDRRKTSEYLLGLYQRKKAVS